MGLVDYSDSESDNDTTQIPTAAKATDAPASSKKSFQKLVDKTNPGKIIVNLPSAPTIDDATPSSEPAAKRIKTGGSRFSGFSSFLPPPKAISKPAHGSKSAPKVGINLKTSSEAAFSREATAASVDGNEGSDGPIGVNTSGGPGLKLPPPRATDSGHAQPSIPDGQKPAEEVTLVGKPMMFKPLSVARKPGRKSVVKNPAVSKASKTSANTAVGEPAAGSVAPTAASEVGTPAKKKVSLFSFQDDTPTVEAALPDDGSYEPGFINQDDSTLSSEDLSSMYAQPAQYTNYTQPFSASNAAPDSLDAIADDLNLDTVARRELFGRGGGGGKATAKSVINFNLDQEYRQNEELRASGALEGQQHNPLRAIKPGKHSLQQLVNQVQTQRDALEDNFAKNRATQKQAGSKYGFR